MRRAVLMALLVLLGVGAGVAEPRDPVLEMFRAQLEIEKRLLAVDLANLERLQEQLRAGTDRLIRVGDDLLRAEREGEDVGGFAARSADVRRAEAEVTDLVGQAQQLRTTVAARRGFLDQVQSEIKRLEGAPQESGDEISGRWQVSFEPGAIRGTFELQLDGTLVAGVYQLGGGWKGSLRGTMIGTTLRLERIDSQLGFVAIYTGRLVARGSEKRLEGTWESTNLAAGLPSAGTWVGRKDSGRP